MLAVAAPLLSKVPAALFGPVAVRAPLLAMTNGRPSMVSADEIAATIEQLAGSEVGRAVDDVLAADLTGLGHVPMSYDPLLVAEAVLAAARA